MSLLSEELFKKQLKKIALVKSLKSIVNNLIKTF